jgi:hypothetical protein
MKSVDAQKYCNLMQESKHRTKVVISLIKGDVNLGYLPVNVEAVYLQFRKILELIAFGSLIANRHMYSQARKKYASDWNAKKVLDLAETLNPKFYPVPINQVKVEGKEYSTEFQPVVDGFLTRSDFERLYNICGGVLHSENPYGNTKEYNELWASAPGWMLKIRNLLNSHEVHPVGNKRQFYLIQMGSDGDPTYTLFEQKT